MFGKETWYDVNLLKFTKTCDLTYDLSWRIFCVCLKIVCIRFLLGEMSYMCLLGPFGLKYSLSPMFSYGYSFEIIYLLLKVLSSPTSFVLSISPFRSVSICLLNLGVLMWVHVCLQLL